MTKLQTLGQRIRHYRKKSGLSQTTLAAAVGVSVNAVSFYEKNKREPNIQMILRIAAALNITGEALLGLVREDRADAHNAESALLGAFRSLNDHGRDLVLEYAASLSETAKFSVRHSPNII